MGIEICEVYGSSRVGLQDERGSRADPEGAGTGEPRRLEGGVGRPERVIRYELNVGSEAKERESL